jgi:hypothetical protein
LDLLGEDVMGFGVVSERALFSIFVRGSLAAGSARREANRYANIHSPVDLLWRVFRSTNCSHAQYARSLSLATTAGYQANQRCHSTSSSTRLVSMDPRNRDIARLRRERFRNDHFIGPPHAALKRALASNLPRPCRD